jgi:hypothetical protein
MNSVGLRPYKRAELYPFLSFTATTIVCEECLYHDTWPNFYARLTTLLSCPRCGAVEEDRFIHRLLNFLGYPDYGLDDTNTLRNPRLRRHR